MLKMIFIRNMDAKFIKANKHKIMQKEELIILIEF